MIPVIALVGRPNVGKSTLFNTLTRTRDALVHDQPGVTRDRLYGRIRRSGKTLALLVDTGGLNDDSAFGKHIDSQVAQVLTESDKVVLLVDGDDGLAPDDQEIALMLRREGVEVIPVVNKTEGMDRDVVTAEFQALGLGRPLAISAKRGDRVNQLLDKMLEGFPPPDDEEPHSSRIRVAIVGRPNAGKSTLINAITGEKRVIVMDHPGTTRDSVDVPFQWEGDDYVLVDTAGMRRKGAISEDLEQFSVVRAIHAIERAHVCVLVLDAHREPSEQDAALAGMIHSRGRSIVVLVNKWDHLSDYKRKRFLENLERRVTFLPPHEAFTISALHGSGLADVLPAVKRAYASAMIEMVTSDLNRRLEMAVQAQAPPMHNGRVVKLKFAYQEAHNPPTVTIRGNRLDSISQTYKRYLSNFLQKSYDLVGTRVRIKFKKEENPYDRRVRNKSKPVRKN